MTQKDELKAIKAQLGSALRKAAAQSEVELPSVVVKFPIMRVFSCIVASALVLATPAYYVSKLILQDQFDVRYAKVKDEDTREERVRLRYDTDHGAEVKIQASEAVTMEKWRTSVDKKIDNLTESVNLLLRGAGK